MDFTALQEGALANLPHDVWDYFQGTADGDPDRDTRAWARWDLVPRVLTQLSAVDTTVSIGRETFTSPLVIAPSASQGAANPDGELATRRAAAAAGLLLCYSFHATIEVERFAAAADAPWWGQAYVMQDRSVSDHYLSRCAAAGAGAIVLTVDVPGRLADAAFRQHEASRAIGLRGNHPVGDAGAIPLVTESSLGPDEIARTADITGLPVWVKGVMTAQDADRAISAGAAGVFVSNHARRQLAGVAPTAAVLGNVLAGVEGRVPVLIDGGIRSGTDVVRALAMGADAAAIGRPVLWALAAGGQAALDEVLETLIDEVRIAMAGLGAGHVEDLVPEMVQPAIV